LRRNIGFTSRTVISFALWALLIWFTSTINYCWFWILRFILFISSIIFCKCLDFFRKCSEW
jgi:hypothetical protein